MFETILIATDGSDSVRRAVAVALDLADRFDATVHALSIVDAGEVDSSPEAVSEQLRTALSEQADAALTSIAASTDQPVQTAVRDGPTRHRDQQLRPGGRRRYGRHRHARSARRKPIFDRQRRRTRRPNLPRPCTNGPSARGRRRELRSRGRLTAVSIAGSKHTGFSRSTLWGPYGRTTHQKRRPAAASPLAAARNRILLP